MAFPSASAGAVEDDRTAAEGAALAGDLQGDACWKHNRQDRKDRTDQHRVDRAAPPAGRRALKIRTRRGPMSSY